MFFNLSFNNTKIDLPIKDKIQTLLFSATFSKEIKHTAKNILKQEFLIITNDVNEYKLNKNIEQIFYYVEENDKLRELHSLLQKSNGFIISK